jgi:ubiquinone/menaquinone biosynthesis C-methylase UbiE
LGCATGRVLRHFALQKKDYEIYGADLNRNHVRWMQEYLPTNLKVFQNTALPSLPLPDNSISVLYAFSVFTHIDDFEEAWIMEINRILKPGGIAIVTIHSELTWNNMEKTSPVFHGLALMKEHIKDWQISIQLFEKPMPQSKIVFRDSHANVYNTIVFHSWEYIYKVWGRLMHVLTIDAQAHGYQDAVVLKKR